ncbi:MAG TPA: sigma-70 family RNA polymerase sigma factor [Gemmataceae bacterium]|nr:sigma-70 family RNA polymerase sigma factor [Gemmataceae bacterium]
MLYVIRLHLDDRLRSILDSADLLQDVFMEFFVRRAREFGFQSEGELLTYLLKLARSRTLDANRKHLDAKKRDRSREVPLDSPCINPEGLVVPSLSAEEQVLLEEAEKELLARLGRKQRRAVRWRDRGYPLEQMARQMDLSARTVQRLLQRARDRCAEGSEASSAG